MGYSEDIIIDPEGLDVEWVKQPKLAFNYAKRLASAREEVDKLKEQVDVYIAELKLKVRRRPEKHGLTKLTEASLNELVEIDTGRLQLVEQLRVLQREAEIINAAVKAIDQKKSALENLVKLHGQSYFAGPKVPRDIGKEWVKQTEREGARELVKNKTGVGKKK